MKPFSSRDVTHVAILWHKYCVCQK